MKTLFHWMGDAGWFLIGLFFWLICLGFAEINTSNAQTRRVFVFPPLWS